MREASTVTNAGKRAARGEVSSAELASFFEGIAPKERELARELRKLVRRCAPDAAEAIRFGALSFFHPGRAYGAIGGNICMIEAGTRGLRLSFIHGANLADPAHLLEGSAKAKRFLPIRSAAQLRERSVRELVLAAARANAGESARDARDVPAGAPDRAALSKLLGAALQHWERFLTDVPSSSGGVSAEWKRYTNGWRLVLKTKRRNVAYLNPAAGEFVASFAFDARAVEAAQRAKLPAALLEQIASSPVFPEGRAVRITVANARDAAHARTLLALKLASLD